MEHIIITGVSTGIGYACVDFFLKKGYFVFGSVRKEADAQRLENTFGPNFKALIFDVTDQEAVQKSVQVVENIIGNKRLAGLVNNAGISVTGPLMHLPIEDIRFQLEVNVLGLVRTSQAFLPLLGARKPHPHPPGRLVNISSVAGRFTNPFMGPYCASKHAVEAITDAFRRELVIYGIDAISIQPGPIKTEIWDKVIKETPPFSETDFAPVMARLSDFVQESEKSAIPAIEVAKRVYQAVTLKRPKTRYVVAGNGRLLKIFLKAVPDRVADYFVKKKLKM